MDFGLVPFHHLMKSSSCNECVLCSLSFFLCVRIRGEFYWLVISMYSGHACVNRVRSQVGIISTFPYMNNIIVNYLWPDLSAITFLLNKNTCGRSGEGWPSFERCVADWWHHSFPAWKWQIRVTLGARKAGVLCCILASSHENNRCFFSTDNCMFEAFMYLYSTGDCLCQVAL